MRASLAAVACVAGSALGRGCGEDVAHEQGRSRQQEGLSAAAENVSVAAVTVDLSVVGVAGGKPWRRPLAAEVRRDRSPMDALLVAGGGGGLRSRQSVKERPTRRLA